MITINDILYRVYRNPLLQNVRKVDVIDHVKTLLGILRIPLLMEEKPIHLLVKDFRAPLPPEVFDVKGVSLVKDGKVINRLQVGFDDRMEHHRTMRDRLPSTVTYKYVPGWIYLDKEELEIEVIVKQYRVDDNGFPILPENQSLLLAIENFIKVQYFTILVETGHMSMAILDKAEQQYEWYVGQTSNYFDTPSEEEAQSIIDSLFRLIPDNNAFFTNFKYNSNTEILRDHD